MKLPFEFWIGTRYAGFTRAKTRTKKRDRFVSFIAASSMAGIALSVATLIIVMSVMNGFRVDVRDRMLSVLPHIQVYNPGLSALDQLQDWKQLAKEAEENSNVVGASPFVAAGAMVARGSSLRGVQVRGIEPQYESSVSDLPKQMVEGSLDTLLPGSFHIVIGTNLADALGVHIGDTILILAPQGNISPAGFAPRMRQFTVSGIFSSGYYEYDSGMVFMSAKDAAILFRDTALGGVRLKVKDMLQAPEVANQLMMSMGSNDIARDWTQDNRTWFAAVKTEKRMMFLILALLVAIAAFNLLSSLVMAVKDKQSDIAILRTLGARPASIAKIFVVQGALIGIIGTFLGVSVGCLIAYHIDVIIPFIEGLFGIHFLDPSIYLISELPSRPDLQDITIVAITALVLSLIATLYPSWRASRLQPAEVLRHD